LQPQHSGIILPEDPSYHEKELLHRIAAGSEEAFAELYHLYNPKLSAFLTKLARSEYIAQEMVQETFLRLWVNREKLREVNHVSAWIYKIASNVSYTYLRTQANRKKILESVAVEPVAESFLPALDSRQLDLIIRQTVDKLPERRQEIYRLSREQGLTHQQIADQLNLSANTVKNQITLSLKFIYEQLSKETGLSLLTLLVLFLKKD
jgi:RNA polymerase sigma-70 factor (family 1)